MKISIKTRDGNKFDIDANSNDSIDNIKNQIYRLKSIPKEQQRLIFDFITLKDEEKLTNYSIQNGSEILLFKKEETLLLKSSKIFLGSSLIDHIHQSYIDLETKPDVKDVTNLLIEAISYLDEKLDINIIKEIFFLILSCFFQYPEESFKIYQIRYQNPSISSIHIVILTAMISFIVCNNLKIPISSYNDFLSSLMSEVLPQLEKNTFLKIKEFEIVPEFKMIFITNLVLANKLTEKIVKSFSSYFFSKETDLSMLNFFIKRAHSDNLLAYIPESFFIENNLFLQLSYDNIENFLSIVSKQNFQKILPLLINFIENNGLLSTNLSNIIMNKCIEFNISSKSINVLIQNYNNFKSLPIWEYMNKNMKMLTDNIVDKIQKSETDSFAQTPLILKLAEHPERLPNDILTYSLLNNDDINVYVNIFKTDKIECDVLTTIEFWKHILSLINNQTVNPNNFMHYFQKTIEKNDIFTVFDQLIFDNSLPNQKQSEFLSYLLNALPRKYNHSFHTHDKELATKLIKRNEIPSPSLLKLFNLKSINIENEITPRILYCFAIKRINLDIKSIEIMNFEPNDNLIKFIEEENDFDLIREIDENSLSLIACSFYYANNIKWGTNSRDNMIKLIGLTKENFLPFSAIWLKNREVLNLYLFDEKLFAESYNYFIKNPSPLQKASFNSLIMNNDFFLRCFFTRKINFLELMISSFIKGEYQADVLILLQAIFIISFSQTGKNLFLYSNELFNTIIQYVPEIVSNPIFRNKHLNLNVFNKIFVSEKLANLIDLATSYEQIIIAIKFIHSCRNTSFLSFKNGSNINTALEKAFYDENWDDASDISDFIKRYNIKINTLNLYGKHIPLRKLQLIYDTQKIKNIDEIITVLLSISDLEENINLFQSVFLCLMSNKSMSIKLITIYLEKITNQQILKPQSIIEKLAYFNLFYKNDLIDAISQSYLYSETKEYFIKKIRRRNSVQTDNLRPKFDFLTKLIQNNSYQSFICLQNIATHFPFLFEPEPNQNNGHSLIAIEIVLPALNFFSQMFSLNETDKNLNDLKKAFSALSFLHACLYSVSFLSTFVLWIFENITKLTDSQIYGLSLVLISLFKTDSIKKIVTAYAFKYKILDIISSLFNREIHNEQFKYHYNQNLYELSLLYFINIDNVRMKGDAIFIEQIQDNKIKDPFKNQFNDNMTINPVYLSPLNFAIKNTGSQMSLISNFINDINRIGAFWIFENENATRADVDLLLKDFPKDTAEYQKVEIRNCPQLITNEIHTYLLSCPNWKMNYFENRTPSLQSLSYFSSYYYSINSTIAALNSIIQPDYLTNSYRSIINPYEYFKSSLVSNSFFNTVIKEASICDNIKDNKILSDLITKLTQVNDESFNFFIKNISEYISKEQISSQILGRLCQILEIIFMNKKGIVKDFFEICGNKLIDIVLSNQFRSDELLLISLSSALKLIKEKLPTKVAHIIGLIFNYHPKLIGIAIELYFKVDNIKSVDLMPLIKKRYEKDVVDENPDFKRIKACIYNFTTLPKDSLQTTKILLRKAIDNYIISNCKRIELLEIIVKILNGTAPNPIKNKVQINNEEKSGEDYLRPPPEYLKEADHVFWVEIYEENLALLNEMVKINKNISRNFLFLFDYPELISFDLRYFIYQKYINNVRSSGNSIHLHVSRQRLLLDSYGYWIIYSPKDFITRIQISFKGEHGVDAGGLTREWITYLVKELLDPKYGIFIKNDNQTYNLNPSFELNLFNTECLKMAGGIIALSMIKKTNINAHLSTSLLKQILHQEIHIDDMKESDELLYNSFQLILKSEDVKPLDLVFSIDEESQNGKLNHINLIENGDNVKVTNENKHEYVKLYANHKLKNSISNQLKAFCEGFESVINPKCIKMFTPKELDMIICGKNYIDIENMKKYVSYDGDYDKDHPVIKMFYNVISKWSQEDLSKLILFITGSANIGINGFEDFTGNNDNSINIISSQNSKNHLPIAHTCSNQLVLPEYDNEKDMNDKLLMAIQDCQFEFY